MATPVILQNVSLRMTAGELRQFPADPIPQIALCGRSNVGKSSLINSLLGRKSLARVTSPGTALPNAPRKTKSNGKPSLTVFSPRIPTLTEWLLWHNW